MAGKFAARVRSAGRKAGAGIRNAFTVKERESRWSERDGWMHKDVRRLRPAIKKTLAVLAISAALVGGRAELMKVNQHMRMEAKQFITLCKKNPGGAIASVYPTLSLEHVQSIQELARKTRVPLPVVLEAMELADIRDWRQDPSRTNLNLARAGLEIELANAKVSTAQTKKEMYSVSEHGRGRYQEMLRQRLARETAIEEKLRLLELVESESVQNAKFKKAVEALQGQPISRIPLQAPMRSNR